METFTLSLPLLCMICFFVFLAGFVDAAAGGGGLISLPAYIATGMPAHMAYGCNKFSSACGTTLASVRFFKNRAMMMIMIKEGATTPSVAQIPPQAPLTFRPIKVATFTAMAPGVH